MSAKSLLCVLCLVDPELSTTSITAIPQRLATFIHLLPPSINFYWPLTIYIYSMLGGESQSGTQSYKTNEMCINNHRAWQKAEYKWSPLEDRGDSLSSCRDLEMTVKGMLASKLDLEDRKNVTEVGKALSGKGKLKVEGIFEMAEVVMVVVMVNSSVWFRSMAP